MELKLVDELVRLVDLSRTTFVAADKQHCRHVQLELKKQAQKAQKLSANVSAVSKTLEKQNAERQKAEQELIAIENARKEAGGDLFDMPHLEYGHPPIQAIVASELQSSQRFSFDEPCFVTGVDDPLRENSTLRLAFTAFKTGCVRHIQQCI